MGSKIGWLGEIPPFQQVLVVDLSAEIDKGDFAVRNQVYLKYGLAKVGTNEFRKNSDDLLVVTALNRKLSSKYELTAMVRVRTQMTKGYKYEGNPDTIRLWQSDFFAPGYIIPSLGLTYNTENKIILTLSPLTGKFTVVAQDSLTRLGLYGVEPGQWIKSQAGTGFAAKVATKLVENVTLNATLGAFTDYLDYFKSVDFNFNMLITMKVNSFLVTSFSLTAIYDNDIIVVPDDGSTPRPLMQLQDILNVGLTYKFGT